MFNFIVFICFLLMGLQFTEYRFISKESLIAPAGLLITIQVYYLFLNRKVIWTKNSFVIFSLTTLFFIYYILNFNKQAPFKSDYVLWLFVIYLLFCFISFFHNKVIFYPIWILFIFIYSNLLFIPPLLTHMSFTSANSTGIISLLLMFFCVINLKVPNILLKLLNFYNLLLLIVVLFVATSRAAMLAFFIIIFVYLAVSKLHKKVFLFTAFFIAASQAFTLLYIYLHGTQLGNALQELSLNYTGKNFFSGRDVIWRGAFEEVSQSRKFLTGLGNNIQYTELNGYLHNAYVQLIYQSGIVGLLLLTSVILAIAYIAGKVKTSSIDHSFKTLLAFFIGILSLQVLEGHLVYKFELISVLCWVIIALFVNKILTATAKQG